jgi:hypothetical protein
MPTETQRGRVPLVGKRSPIRRADKSTILVSAISYQESIGLRRLCVFDNRLLSQSCRSFKLLL